ncbi:MAG: NAD(+) synthase [Lachnospiraceae bacterium]|nr:NAD(+) synthase [Lachnospiraceae bacterium]
MKDGFIRVATATPKLKVADCDYNEKEICALIDEAANMKVNVLVFPELCITAKTCADLFLQDALLTKAKQSLLNIVEYSRNVGEMLIFVGLPYMLDSKLYNVAAAFSNGELLGLVPKLQLSDELRYFNTCDFNKYILVGDKQVAFGNKLLFKCKDMDELLVGAELCEDLWAVSPRSIEYAQNGALLIVNLAADFEAVEKANYRKELVLTQSARLVCAYAFANAGDGESTQDMVFSGHSIIAEDGKCISERKAFTTGINYAVVDLQKLRNERRRLASFNIKNDSYMMVEFTMSKKDIELDRDYEKTPFVPDEAIMEQRCETILSIQANALKKRLEHTNTKNVVIGISGGLDSTLALLVIVRTFDMLGLPHENIKAITMPCFGTSDITYNNALKLIKLLGADFKEINIVKAVRQHFEDIGQDENVHDVTFENAQARERTQILMDMANKVGGMVIGTGDLSELVLGFATYNGDHMSMYGVNASIPKTLVKYLVRYCAMNSDAELKEVLMNIVETPVSPELLPPKEGEISQQTESIVGPYKLQDFFMYYALRYGFEPNKIFRIAVSAFKDEYSSELILKWLKMFYRRFFAQQFKRSCLPDGPKVGSVGVSPRGDLKMPSDAVVKLWLDQLENM